jgi:hypothetical protein
LVPLEIGAAPSWSGYARKLTWRVSTAFEFCSLQRRVEQICRAHESVAMIGEVCAASRRGVFSSNTERTHTRDTRRRGSRSCNHNRDTRNCNRGRSSRSHRETRWQHPASRDQPRDQLRGQLQSHRLDDASHRHATHRHATHRHATHRHASRRRAQRPALRRLRPASLLRSPGLPNV